MFALLIWACAYPPEDFAVDMAEATCALYEQCDYLETFGFASAGECATTVEASYDPEVVACPDYDKELAEACVEGVTQMSCDDLYAAAWPTACAERCGFVATGGDGGGTDGGSTTGG